MAQLETSRTYLRHLKPSDFASMRMLESDPLVMRFTPSRIPQTEEQTGNRLKSQIEKQKDLEPFGIWVAFEKNSDSFIGWFMLIPNDDGSLELGFMIVQSQWRKGFATEIGKVLVDYGRSRSIAVITATTNIDNFASMSVLTKLGFHYSRNIKVPEKVLDGEVELKVYELDLSSSGCESR